MAVLTITDAKNFQVKFLGNFSPALFHQLSDGSWIEYETSKKFSPIIVEQKSDRPEEVIASGGGLGFRMTNKVGCGSFEIAEQKYDLVTFPTAIDALKNRIKKKRF